MARTAADHQAAFRKRMQAKGYRLKQIWVDADGFPGKGYKEQDVNNSELSLSQLNDELVRLTTGADDLFAARLYGELVSYARGVRELWDLTCMSPDLFKAAEANFENKNRRP